MIKLMKYFKKTDWIIIFISIVLIAGQVWFELTLPDYVKEITTLVSTEGSSINEVLIAGVKMLACALGSMFLAIIVGYFVSRLASNFSYSIRGKVFNKISEFGDAEMKKFSTPSLITRTTNDITQIQMLIAMGLQVIIKAPILSIWAIIKIFGKSWELSIVVMVSVAVLVITIALVVTLVLPKFKVIQKQIDGINRVADESLSGVKVVRAFNADKYQANKFEDVNDKLTKTNLFTMRTLSVLQPVLNLVMSGLSLAIYYVGSILINNAPYSERLSVLGDVVSFSSYGGYVVMSFIMLSMIFMILPRAQVSAKRMNEVIDEDISVKEGTKSFTQNNGTIEFKNVSFKYPNADENTLLDISFKIEKGETLAIVGTSGSGKSTLVNLIARLYDATSGEVLIDGENIKDYNFACLYSKIGYIPQKSVVFSDTVKNNICFGESEKEITEDDVLNAIDIAQAKEFVDSMPLKYDSDIAQGGINISGGQKQRLSIARAIAKKPEILIFDDSFSALDFKTDKKLRDNLDNKLSGTTKVVVASRIGTIKNADKIIVLEDGKIVGFGSHNDLMQNCDMYKEIALSQLSMQELKG